MWRRSSLAFYFWSASGGDWHLVENWIIFNPSLSKTACTSPIVAPILIDTLPINDMICNDPMPQSVSQRVTFEVIDSVTGSYSIAVRPFEDQPHGLDRKWKVYTRNKLLKPAIFLKIVVNGIALPFRFFGLSLKIQSCCFQHIKESPKIPWFLEYHVFRVHTIRPNLGVFSNFSKYSFVIALLLSL